MTSRSWRGVFVPLLILGIGFVGCAKRPATTQASAPAPTGTAMTTPGGSTTPMGGSSGVVSTAPSSSTSSPQGPTGSGTATGPDSGGQRGSATTLQGGTPGSGPAGPSGPATTMTSPGGATIPPTAPQPQATTPVPRPALSEFTENAALEDIYFDFDQSSILPDAAKKLDTNASWMKSNPNHLVLIEGHCDERGTNEYNLALGERRARSTLNYLVAQGVQANRITIISYGEERPVCTEKTEACWAKNRRAHFLVKAR